MPTPRNTSAIKKTRGAWVTIIEIVGLRIAGHVGRAAPEPPQGTILQHDRARASARLGHHRLHQAVLDIVGIGIGAV